jgi:hypothetical protein
MDNKLQQILSYDDIKTIAILLQRTPIYQHEMHIVQELIYKLQHSLNFPIKEAEFTIKDIEHV